MKVKYDYEHTGKLFDHEVKLAIDWLFKVKDEETDGWAWVQFISPNEQNTAEVVTALLENSEFLTEKMHKSLAEAIKAWLINPKRNCKISLDWSWVLMSLQHVRDNEKIQEHIDLSQLASSIVQCVDWLIENQNTDGGWADIKGDLSSTARTSLAVIALCREFPYSNDTAMKTHLKKALQAGVKWLLDTQHPDGGWGNIREKDINRNYQDLINLPYADLRYQCDSNAACTGYAVLALYEDLFDNHTFPIGKAIKFIKSSQQGYGGWDVFSEVGIRAKTKYTFRHFSTAWALKAMLYTKNADYTDECVITGINYLSQLQDPYYGGWKSSLDADNYTWATCNALETIKLIKTQLAEVKAKQFLQIVCDWWDLRKKDSSFSIRIGKAVFAFNAATILLFSIVFTIMMFFVMGQASNFFAPLFFNAGEKTGKFINGVMLVLGAFIIGLPWVVFVKNVFRKNMDSWIESIGWVYGIITGFLLAYYQFLM